MRDVMGIIYSLKNTAILEEITRRRCIASVPFAGKYRLVDFVLSNMVNSGMRNIGVITSRNTRSLIDHLGQGREWGLDKKHDGLFILPAVLPFRQGRSRLVDLEDIYNNRDYLRKSSQKYVIISGSNMVYNTDYHKILQFHREHGGDLTMLFYDESLPAGKGNGRFYLELGEGGQVAKLSLRQRAGTAQKLAMNLFVLEKALLVQMLEHAASRGSWDLVRDILSMRRGAPSIYGYPYQGYLAVIDSVAAYYRHHMDLLNPEGWLTLFSRDHQVYTKYKDEPPAKYCGTAEVKNALVANGCLIEGNVENSVLYRGVKVGRGAVIRNSVIMSKVEIEENAVLEGVILDKQCRVHRGSSLVASPDRPLVIAKQGIV